jgi:hypothetical protein
MSDTPQSRRRTLLWHSFMPDDTPKTTDSAESWREQASQALVLHTPHSPQGLCEHCWVDWPCDAASGAALVLELLG